MYLEVEKVLLLPRNGVLSYLRCWQYSIKLFPHFFLNLDNGLDIVSILNTFVWVQKKVKREILIPAETKDPEAIFWLFSLHYTVKYTQKSRRLLLLLSLLLKISLICQSGFPHLSLGRSFLGSMISYILQEKKSRQVSLN